MKKIIPIVAAIVVTGLVVFFMMSRTHSTPTPAAPVKKTAHKGAEEAGGEGAPPAFGEIYEMQDLVINPSGSRRVFMVTVALEIADKEQVKEVTKRESLLRDNLITLFASQPLEVLIDVKYRQAFRARVKKIMDYQLGEGIVSRVFFEKWVFQ